MASSGPAPPRPGRVRPSWWPAGRLLADAEAASRHNLVCLFALAQTPLLLLAALLSTHPTSGVSALVLSGLLLVGAVGPFQRRTRALWATGALLVSSALLTVLYPGHSELHAQVLVVVALASLYQDWVVLGLVVTGAVTLSIGSGDAWTLLIGGLAVAEAGVLAVFWVADERSRTGEAMLQAALWEGQASVRARLEETERIRTDLIGTVSHEFRTPLTGIRGAALTLLKRSDRLDAAARRQLLEGILDHQERLSRLLENMLTAARATAADPAAVAEVDVVAAEVAMIAGALRPESPTISVLVNPGTLARIDRQALHQVLANLLDNAQQHGRPGAIPLVAGGRDEHGVWLTVSNEGEALDPATARMLFEPFTQVASGPTRPREGLGMGLYVVRRLVEVYDGSVTVRAESGWVTVSVRLEPADDRRRHLDTHPQVVELPADRRVQLPISEPMPNVTRAAQPPRKS